MDLGLNPTEPEGEYQSQAGFFLLEMSVRAATALSEHLCLFKGT